MIKVMYQCRDAGSELINHDRDIDGYSALCELIDNYPWVREAELTEKYGEGGGLFFTLGDMKGKHALFQLTPVGADEAMLDLSIVLEKGVLGLFGKKIVDKHFDGLTVAQSKVLLKALFEHSVGSLYTKYK